jgi:hypothetical protein
MALLTRLTIEDFEKLPEAIALNRELVDGELVDASGNSGNHNALRDWLGALLLPYVHQNKLGRVLAEQEFDFQGNAHGPDLSFRSLDIFDRNAGSLRILRPPAHHSRRRWRLSLRHHPRLLHPHWRSAGPPLIVTI